MYSIAPPTDSGFNPLLVGSEVRPLRKGVFSSQILLQDGPLFGRLSVPMKAKQEVMVGSLCIYVIKT